MSETMKRRAFERRRDGARLDFKKPEPFVRERQVMKLNDLVQVKNRRTLSRIIGIKGKTVTLVDTGTGAFFSVSRDSLKEGVGRDKVWHQS
jgi:hypothetical protein